jgi:TrmH family RNA methyltransferase
MAEPVFITSPDNALLKELRKLAQDNTAYRKLGRFWVEGDHLCSAAISRGVRPVWGIFSESAWAAVDQNVANAASRVAVLADALFREISALESAGKFGFVVDLPESPAIRSGIATVVLDRVQDAGNVGSILRSAAAFGFGQVLALKGTAALWSAKVLRAGMGAHFGLQLTEGLMADDLKALEIPLLVTNSHEGAFLQDLRLPHPCAWVMGHEGQGVDAQIAASAMLRVRIGQPGGEESLNVAAAAAICLHASSLSAPSA